MQSWTVFKETSFHLPKYVWLGRWKITISPRDSEWISINGTLVNSSSIQWVKDWTWSRYIQIMLNSGKKVKVVEHLLSALIASWVTQANVEILDSFVPVIGPWIQPIYKALVNSNIDFWSELPKSKISSKEIIHSRTYPWASIQFEPSETFDITIDTNHPDLADIWAKRVELTNLYSQVSNFSDARPIARLQKKHIYYTLNTLRCIPPFLRGINPNTYIFAKPGENWDQIVERMWEQYQQWRNEHLYHTIFADFLWEITSFFPWEIQWRFTLINTNHVSRIEILKEYQNLNTL